MAGVIDLKVPMDSASISLEDVTLSRGCVIRHQPSPMDDIIQYQFKLDGTTIDGTIISDKEFNKVKRDIASILRQYIISPKEVLSYNKHPARRVINIDARPQKIEPYVNQELQIRFKKYNEESDIPWELLFR